MLLAAVADLLPGFARAHEPPADVAVQVFVRPAGERLELLVRAPLEAMQDVDFPTFDKGYLDVPRADLAQRFPAVQLTSVPCRPHEIAGDTTASRNPVSPSLASPRTVPRGEVPAERIRRRPLSPSRNLPGERAASSSGRGIPGQIGRAHV